MIAPFYADEAVALYCGFVVECNAWLIHRLNVNGVIVRDYAANLSFESVAAFLKATSKAQSMWRNVFGGAQIIILGWATQSQKKVVDLGRSECIRISVLAGCAVQNQRSAITLTETPQIIHQRISP